MSRVNEHRPRIRKEEHDTEPMDISGYDIPSIPVSHLMPRREPLTPFTLQERLWIENYQKGWNKGQPTVDPTVRIVNPTPDLTDDEMITKWLQPENCFPE